MVLGLGITVDIGHMVNTHPCTLGVLYYGRIGMVNFLLVPLRTMYLISSVLTLDARLLISAFGLKCSHTILLSTSEVTLSSVNLHPFTCYFVKHSFF